ncbi:acyltransferase family protein [Weissella cibaria]|uniref:acyltransferase family protein n=1 Tax=Weissella cibaria TaxID=137591 RepID=UPI002A7475AD|nr:acyltransferase family protein [Weissella cibaria]MDY2520092.1 acyltransferase family protein [Weissella cibaria]
MKKEKKSNFELLRIVAMLMIIIFHSLVNFVGTRDSQYISNNIELGGVLLMLRYVFGQLGVILFAMISGYFLISAREKKNPFERAMATAVKFAGMLLYNGVIISVVIAVIYMAVRKLGLVGPIFYEIINTTRNIFDDSHLIFGYLGGFWYLSVYFLLLVVINPLNHFLNKLTDNRTFLALIVVVIFISVLFKFTLFLSLG